MTEVSKHSLVFIHKWEAAVSRGIWTILPRWAAEFCELAHGIWHNFPRKVVGPTYEQESVLSHRPRNLDQDLNSGVFLTL